MNGCTVRVFPIAETRFVVASMKIQNKSLVSDVTVQVIALPMIRVICCSIVFIRISSGKPWGGLTPGVLHCSK